MTYVVYFDSPPKKCMQFIDNYKWFIEYLKIIIITGNEGELRGGRLSADAFLVYVSFNICFLLNISLHYK